MNILTLTILNILCAIINAYALTIYHNTRIKKWINYLVEKFGPKRPDPFEWAYNAKQIHIDGDFNSLKTAVESDEPLCITLSGYFHGKELNIKPYKALYGMGAYILLDEEFDVSKLKDVILVGLCIRTTNQIIQPIIT